MLASVVLLGAISLAAEAPLQQILERVAEEAEVFLTAAPKMLSEETWRQKVIQRASRFRPRAGSGTQAAAPKFKTREVVSEYGYSTFADSPDTLHEFREVTTVDGRVIASREKARRTLTMGVTSRDDRLKKKMLENFEKNGLVGAAVDFGQIILLFGKRRLGEYQFEFAGTDRIRDEDAIGFFFRQAAGKQGVTIFQGSQVIHRPLEGELWVRGSDYLPLRIVLSVRRKLGDRITTDEASVDYAMSDYGVVLPARIVHRQMVAGQVVVENSCTYSPFRMFRADTEIRFQEMPPETSAQHP